MQVNEGSSMIALSPPIRKRSKSSAIMKPA
jgi:hypothetical protein